MAEQTNQFLDLTNLRDILAVLFKHKYTIVVTFTMALAIATLMASRMRPLYEAKSVILVKQGREFLQRPEAGAGTGFAIPPQTIITGEIGILTSKDVVSKVVATVGPETLYPGVDVTPLGMDALLQVAVNLFEKSLSVTNAPGSHLILVKFVHENPYLAAKSVNTLVDVFKDRHLEVFGGNSSGFLENQQKALHGKLRESESSLASFKEKNRIYSLEEQKTAIMQQRTTLGTALREAQNQMSELQQKIAFIRGPRWGGDATGATGTQASSGLQQQLSALQQQLATLQQRERESLQKYTESSGVVQSVRREMKILMDSIRSTSDEMRQEQETARKTEREEQRQIELGKVENELSIIRIRADNLRRQLGQAEADIYALDAHGRRFQDLKREVAEDEQSYQTYARKLEESLIQDDMDRRKMIAVSVVERATPSILQKKQKLSKKQTIAIGFAGGIAAGIALALLLEFMAHGMSTPLAVEKRLGLRVMVAIARK